MNLLSLCCAIPLGLMVGAWRGLYFLHRKQGVYEAGEGFLVGLERIFLGGPRSGSSRTGKDYTIEKLKRN